MKINRLTVFPREITDGGHQFPTLKPQTSRPQTLKWQALRTKSQMEIVFFLITLGLELSDTKVYEP